MAPCAAHCVLHGAHAKTQSRVDRLLQTHYPLGWAGLLALTCCAQADVFNTSLWRHYLKGAVGLVSCLGGFGSNEAMLKVCPPSLLSA